MTKRQVQRKDRAVPQLSCALCRDRKLKCDKLDPCTNCTLSRVTCVPVYRPRRPRGRHARRSRNMTSCKSTTPPPSNNRRRDTSDGGSGPSTSCPSKFVEKSASGIDLGSHLGRLETLVRGGDEEMNDDLNQKIRRDSVGTPYCAIHFLMLLAALEKEQYPISST